MCYGEGFSRHLHVHPHVSRTESTQVAFSFGSGAQPQKFSFLAYYPSYKEISKLLELDAGRKQMDILYDK